MKPGKAAKIIGQWALTQLHYRQPLGEVADKKLCELLGTSVHVALAQITGFCQAGGLQNTEKLKELAQMVEEE